MFGPKIPVDRGLMEKLNKCADQLGYSSGQEFAIHVLEEACNNTREVYSEEDKEKVEERLRGLGYLS